MYLLRCDACGRETTETVLPRNWHQLLHAQTEKQFCSIECVTAYAQKVTIEQRQFIESLSIPEETTKD
jgi:hypothetical protein